MMKSFKADEEEKKIPHVIGYLDVTALHLFYHKSLVGKTIHGAMMKEILK